MVDTTQQLAFKFMTDTARVPVFPSTRYQGSKRKLADWIWESVKRLEFNTVLDAFGGTGAVAHRLKRAGKQVTYNDILAFNYNIGLALIENSRETLRPDEVDRLVQPDPTREYRHFVAETFDGIYFPHAENEWLDTTVQNIDQQLADPRKRAMALFALYQSCMVKRPYNLFHRKNLYIREADVKRSFGNKKTWDTSFESHFRKFVAEANASIFDNGLRHKALNQDVLSVSPGYDLVYIDPPYMSQKGVSVSYHEFYHFLEGLTHYDRWNDLIDFETKHRRLKYQPSPWDSVSRIRDAFEAVFERFASSILVVSYRSDGIPTREDLVNMLHKHKHTVGHAAQPRQYVLSTNAYSKELLLVAA